MDLNDDDKNSTEWSNVVRNPWYQNNNNKNINRRISRIPYSIIVLDGEEVGVELIDWNEPKKFHGGENRKESKQNRYLDSIFSKI